MAQITVRIPDGDKREATRIVTELGLDMSTVTRAFYRQIIRERRLPLDLSLGRLPAETEEAIAESRRLAQDPDAKAYDTGSDLIDALSSTGEGR